MRLLPAGDVLGHPSRLHVLQSVQRDPGLNLQELCRSTGLPWGTLRHHVAVLARAGLLIMQRDGRTARVFQPQAPPHPSHLRAALMRDPALASLHAWLQANPGSPRREVLGAMQANGWSLSTTRHRLDRLAGHGLVDVQDQEGSKTYRAAPVAEASHPPWRG